MHAFLSPKCAHPNKPILAEVKMATMLVHHNTLFNLPEHMTKYVRSEFQAAETAAKFSCGCTKTSSIVNCVRADFKEKLGGYEKILI